MHKRLVICCDGTWNTPDQVSGGHAAPTNVTKLALAVASTDSEGTEQRVYYHQGVGTRQGERLRGGAFGLGLSRAVRDVYAYLVATFEPGDEIFFFGFSRGAFTARSSAGLVRNCGVLRPEHADRVDDAYRLYRSRQAHPRGTEARLFRRSFSYETRIRFIGVWDTVGALGVPLTGLRLLSFSSRRAQFHDTDLSTKVDAAFQALAIDEKRRPFRPAIWDKQPSDRPQEVAQVWFPGVHCDVGGGCATHELADLSLLWMTRQAERYRLAVDHALLMAGPFAGQEGAQEGVPTPDPLGPVHESRTGFYRLLKPWSRPIGRPVPPADTCESASSAAVERHGTTAYAPRNLVDYLAGAPHVTDL